MEGTDEYRALRAAVHPMAQLLRQHAATPGIELEFRLGRIDAGTGRWTSDMGFTVHDTFLARCAAPPAHHAPAALRFGPWSEHVDFAYALDDGRAVRTRVTYDASTCTVARASVRKRRVETIEAAIEGTPFAVRLDASIEEPVEDASLPEAAEPTRVAISQRCSAAYGRRGSGAPLWRYDATMQWAGASHSAAEHLQRSSSTAPAYMMELEFTGKVDDPEAYGAERLVVSGLLKVMDIVGAGDATLALRGR